MPNRVSECRKLFSEIENGWPSLLEIEAQVVRRITDLGFRVDPLPDVPIDKFVAEYIRRNKPFKGDGTDEGKGLADWLIWQSVVARAAGLKEVYFISANSSDFGSEREGALAPNLISSLGGRHNVVWLKDLKSLFERFPVVDADQSKDGKWPSVEAHDGEDSGDFSIYDDVESAALAAAREWLENLDALGSGGTEEFEIPKFSGGRDFSADVEFLEYVPSELTWSLVDDLGSDTYFGTVQGFLSLDLMVWVPLDEVSEFVGSHPDFDAETVNQDIIGFRGSVAVDVTLGVQVLGNSAQVTGVQDIS